MGKMLSLPRQSNAAPATTNGDKLALMVAVVLGAYVLAATVAHPHSTWVGWVALFPLFIVIRLERPIVACLFGALWGASFCIFSGAVSASPAVDLGFASLVLLTAAVASYAFVGSYLTRWIGFSPFILGVGWMGVELTLAPLGLRHGLLAGAQDGVWYFQVIASLLGYVFVAFLAAYVGALLVSLLECVHVGAAATRVALRCGQYRILLSPQTFSCLPRFAVNPSRPRAPPIHVTAIS